MRTPTPETETFHRAKRVVGALIIGLGGLLLLDQVVAQLSPASPVNQEDKLYPTDHYRPPPTRPGHVVEV